MSPYTQILVIWMTFGALLWASSSLAQSNQGNLLLSSLEMNQKLMTSAQAKDLDKIEQLLPIIKPLTDAHKAKFGIDIESELKSALSAQDHNRVLRAAQQLVHLDLKDMLGTAHEVMGTSMDQAKSVLKAAYLTYLLLSPYIQRDHFTTDQKVRKNFRAAILTLIASTPYREEKGEATKAIVDRLDKVKELIMEIEREIGEALGDFKSSWQDGPFRAAEHGKLQAFHTAGHGSGR